MNITVRRAKLSDAEKVSDLYCQISQLHHEGRPDIFKPAFRKYTQNEFMELICMKEFAVLVAEDEGGIVHGYAFCKIRCFESSIIEPYKALYIDDICVDRESRGQHVGKALFEAVKELASELNCDNIELNVWEFNESAIRFYEKMGMTTQRRCMELKLK